jgi:hypothetical protein
VLKWKRIQKYKLTQQDALLEEEEKYDYLQFV